MANFNAAQLFRPRGVVESEVRQMQAMRRADSAEGSSDDDVGEDTMALNGISQQSRSSTFKLGFGAPGLMAAVLSIGFVVATYVFWPSSTTKVQSALSQQERPRLLDDETLFHTAVEHSIKFYNEGDDEEFKSMSSEKRQLFHDELIEVAKVKTRRLAMHVSAKDSEAARQLQELRITDEQWQMTHKILEGLHDQRVREIGQKVFEAVKSGESTAARSRVNKELVGRSEELRQLRDELIPKALHNVPEGPGGLRNWEVSAEADGVEADGEIAGWGATIHVGFPEVADDDREDKHAEESTRLLEALPVAAEEAPPPVPSTVHTDPMFVRWVHTITGVVGYVITTIISIITTVITIMSGKPMAKLFWITQGLLDGIVCLSTFGAMTPWLNWIPCMIMSFFFGIEAIWTFLKH